MRHKICLTLILAVSYISLASMVWAAPTGVAKVITLLGEAKYLKQGTSEWKVLEKEMILTEGDSLKTAEDTLVTLEIAGTKKSGEVVIKSNSLFTLETFEMDGDTLLNVETGSVLVKAEKLIGESKFEVKTPTSIVGVRGTIFEVQVSKS